MGRLDRKVALVTGAAHPRGLGRSICLQLAADGASVAVSDKMPGADAVAGEIRAAGGVAKSLELDVTDPVAVDVAVSEVLQSWDQLDILVNNAGVIKQREVVDLTPEEWDFHFDVMAKGTYLCSRAAARSMISRGQGGRIVNIASVNAKRPFAYEVAYAAAKAAVMVFSQGLALELGKHNITVNAICPGAMDTDMLARSLADVARESGRKEQEVWHEVTRAIPLRRLGTPEDIARVCAFLCSEEAGYITGAAIDVTGGWMIP
ncbi:MAG: SDR family oxidoreductase [Ardenticatenaceae bacterium]|nr:SDR family oxidoreductase [Ardenticatenaceae bacterium]